MVNAIVLGVTTLGVGLVLYRIGRGMAAPDEVNVARAKTLEEAKPFALAGPGEDVLVEGDAAAGPEGPLTAPLSGIQAAWLRLETTEERSTSADDAFESIGSVDRGQSLAIVQLDGSRVPVRMGGFGIAGLSPKRTGPVVRPSAALATFLAESGAREREADDFVRRREYMERVLPIGQHVFVLGVKRGAKAQGGGAYRDGGEEAWVEPTLADVEMTTERIVLAAKPSPPGVTLVLGWVFSFGGPLAAIVLIATGNEPDAATALVFMPIACVILWAGLGILKSTFFD
jgi:hypothetical protein